MRTVYLGTSDFAATVLKSLAASAHRPVLVVSRPDRRQGRGRRLLAPAVALAAGELGIESFQPESVNDEAARRRIADCSPDRLIVCAYGALIKEPLLSEHGPILNVHPSLLPRWRGAAPIERAILEGDAQTGVSIMQLTAGLDSGPICAAEPVPIAQDDDYSTLCTRLQDVGAELLLDVLGRSAAGAANCEPQDDTQATYAEKLTAEDRLLDPNCPAAELARRVRALSPHIGARLQLADDSFLGVWRTTVLNCADDHAPAATSPQHDTLPDIAAADGNLWKLVETSGFPALPCSRGLLRLDAVQPPGRKQMSGADWLRGLRR